MTYIGPYGSLELICGWIVFAGICMRFSPRRSCFPLRAGLSIAVCVGLRLCLGQSLFVYYLLLAAFLLGLHLSFQNTIWQTLLVLGISYAMQFLMYSIWLVLSSMLVPNFTFFTRGFWVYAIYLAVFTATAIIFWRITDEFRHFTEIDRFCPPAVVIFLIVIFVSVFLCNEINHFEDQKLAILTRLLSSIVSAMNIWVAIDLLVRRKIEMENAMQQYIIEQQKVEFEIRRETINDLNIKCHDLKYQIRAIYDRVGKGDDSGLQEIEGCIVAFQNSYQTGSEALNMVLSEKARVCAEKGISLNFMGQGGLICFMSDIDICRLFNNAIDNAIEALDKMGPEQRFVGVNISQSGPFISVYFENYYNGQLELSNNMPVTSKENKQNHGFGLKSIRAIADSYGAQFSIAHDGEVFTLNLLFPYSQN